MSLSQGEFSMKKLGLAAIAAFAFLSGPAAAAAQQDFTILNNTGYVIERVYVSASKTDEWEEDVLGEDVLEDGNRVKIRFDKDEESCLFDIRVAYTDGETADWHGINLCEVSVVGLKYDRKDGSTWAETD